VFWVVTISIFLLAVILVSRLVTASRRANTVDWGNNALNLLDGLNRLFCRHFHRLEHGGVALPKSGPVIVACNHISGLDPLLLLAACNRPLRFLIAKEEYERWWLRVLYKHMGCIPVDRTRHAERAFYQARHALENNQAVAIFPQGGLQRTDSPPQRIKRGIVMLADLGGAPIVPLRLSGICGAGRVFAAIFMRSTARLEIGPLITVHGRTDAVALDKVERFITPARTTTAADAIAKQ